MDGVARKVLPAGRRSCLEEARGINLLNIASDGERKMEGRGARKGRAIVVWVWREVEMRRLMMLLGKLELLSSPLSLSPIWPRQAAREPKPTTTEPSGQPEDHTAPYYTLYTPYMHLQMPCISVYA